MFDNYEKELDHDKKEFCGSISNWESANKQTDVFIKSAIQRYKSMKTRCKKYHSYNGIKVEFSLREFLYWWVIQNRFFTFKKVSVGRINHKKNYTFDNIRLEEHSENSIEARERTKSSPWSAKSIDIFINGNHVAIAKSISQAAKYVGCEPNSIKVSAERGYIVKSKWTFTYAN